jgi:hypothetical protein
MNVNAAENGQITVYPTGDLTSFTGQNVTVTVTGYGSSPIEKTFVATVSGDGTSAGYNVSVNDFPVGGLYVVQVVSVDQGSGKVRRATLVDVTIGASQ